MGAQRAGALALLLGAALAHFAVVSGSVVELTDANFDEETSSGVWMVNVYAPGRMLEPLWGIFAEEAKADGVRVGKVDGTKETVLMNRFKVTAFPSIYLLRDGCTYTYNGRRDVPAFKEYATQGYKSDKAWPIYKAPNSVVGRALGKVHSVPGILRNVYRVLSHQKGYSDTAIVLGFLLIPVVAGAVLICLVDAVYVRRARVDAHEHAD